MALGKWDDDLETGNDFIDGQHRELNRLVDELKDCDPESQDAVFAVACKIVDVSIKHFQAVEDLMRRYDYPPDEIHRVLEGIDAFKRDWRANFDPYVTGKGPLSHFLEFVEEYLQYHESRECKALAGWITEHGASPASA